MNHSNGNIDGRPQWGLNKQLGQFLPFGIGNNIVAKYNTDMANWHNMEIAKQTYSKDLEMWNRQNDYNSPVSQMKRFSDAGLNPNLMYGKGDTGNATTLPKYNAPTMQYGYQAANLANVMPVLNTISQIDFRKTQEQGINANVKAKEQEIANAKVTQDLLNLKYAQNLFQFGQEKEFQPKERGLRYERNIQELRNAQQRNELGKTQLQYNQGRNKYQSSLIEATITNLAQSAKESSERVKNLGVSRISTAYDNALKLQELGRQPNKNILLGNQVVESQRDRQTFWANFLMNLLKAKPKTSISAAGFGISK